ncbi:glycerol acyltransferase [Roseomonas terrae]|jgi:1-acyl-sn-glycerol-3-phosphate acyltransferase|uniref:Glycerol acyltransferase n=1 Tax=Neoroseomonas terrae TaxID=424799 RepID=A0ABS5EMB5_9PROT|nr:lysophospholipid acyltransferase family protein [Neoroseomonas terrae]MBR0652168.1 glycerol acyltransferase [Neoroseomonas terrae]
MTPPRDPVALRSARHIAFFDVAFTRFFRRHMRALRIPAWGMPAIPPGAPAVVFANHPSWWDGMAVMLIGRRLLGDRQVFTPMDAAALEKYAFMRRIGVFGIEPGTPRGAAAFLQTARRVLGEPSHLLWINAPGRFADPRERPVPIAPGLARLPELAQTAHFVPLALDYPFWSERKPEMLAAFGQPVPAASLLALDRDARIASFATALADTCDRLTQDAITRDPSRFETILQGREGMGGVYQLWRRAGAMLRGQRFDPRHTPDGPT